MKFVPYTLIRQSTRLTRQARKIFGKDIVLNAYLAEYAHFASCDGESYWKERLDGRNFPKGDTDLNEIDLGNGCIVIQFSTGKYVRFNCSEWGGIIAVNNLRKCDEKF